ncbi:MAG: hypothetical protein M1818_001048 [Claussenomyces sp. TS43310]|nr:MAG: hypothetical protein M1818_001048 [Claussenomyces sp. TS43310]
MGRTSKFSFPVPGRNRTSTKPSGPDAVAATFGDRSTTHGPGISKAQRILGSEGSLNIDAPRRDEDGRSFRSAAPSLSGMSIAISESTRNEDGYTSAWDVESAVLPRYELGAKASSTLLGHRFQEPASTDTSSQRSRARMEPSNTTLNNHYDRQKSPLSISQQTSASSARDLALRKGISPVTPGSPSTPVPDPKPSQQDDGIYPLHQEADDSSKPHADSQPKPKKKPARLDLSRLFSKSRKAGRTPLNSSEPTSRPTSVSSRISSLTRTDDTKTRRKSTKSSSSPPRAYLSDNKSQQNRPPPPQVRPSEHNTLHDLYEEYESLPGNTRQAPPGRIIDHRDCPNPRAHIDEESFQSRPSPFDIPRHRLFEEHAKDTRTGLASAVPWDKQSTTSSRRTSYSVFSDSDLRTKSVLSLSSDEDEEDVGKNVVPTVAASKEYRRRDSSSTYGSHQRPDHTNRPVKGIDSRIMQDGKFLTIPETSPRKERPIEPQAQKKGDATNSPRRSHTSSRPTSLKPAPKMQQPSPPPSPRSIKSQSTFQSSRFMVVSKQEEALLEALRKKRANMRENIIAEHETELSKSLSPPRPKAEKKDRRPLTAAVEAEAMPPPNQDISRRTTRDSDMTIRNNELSEHSMEHTAQLRRSPAAHEHETDASEPSPDLSDFLSFGSDEDGDLTPRTSWIVSRNSLAGRPDPLIDPDFGERELPKKPRSAARLSAVGAIRGFSKLGRVKERNYLGCVDDVTRPMDEVYSNEHEPVWRM